MFERSKLLEAQESLEWLLDVADDEPSLRVMKSNVRQLYLTVYNLSDREARHDSR